MCSAFATAINVNPSIVDINRSIAIVSDAVGDVKGDAGKIRFTARDVTDAIVPGVAVRFIANSTSTTFSSVSGVTNENGFFETSLFNTVTGLVQLQVVVDTTGDGVPNEILSGDSFYVAFIDDIAINGVGINTDSPDGSSVLHVSSSDRGVLIPRVALQGCSDRITVLNPALSLLVYNTQESGSLRVGYVYFDGIDWRNFEF